ncbi:6-pyruvoyl tetrahydrobiopterin synthase, putative [Pedobacter sp. BAL39]|uniref:6-carboxytetrahydropterin synthase QueD n=1 Tax=Pedobacter sp. BAL39 TaxID=391596 RepID=UPI000155A145|nr:6-carboxytetrahydropterin synthase QueD [Pedobacter sp. BAL39]EDM35587.1 6-pyruvoyl tetrahydrobiopterin synthase, putative [Pedobacter sp. BAL39]
MIIYKKFSFDSAHYLPLVPASHKCGRMHGHTYQLTVYLSGTPDPHSGWVADFGDLKRGIQPFVDLLDHRLLNDIPGLENPTSENLSVWLWQKIKPVFPALAKIELSETPGTGVIYEG